MNKDANEQINTLAGHLFREHYGKMVSHLLYKYGYPQVDNILDAVQESFEAALKTWRFAGIPNHPYAWLYKVANNVLLNKIRQSTVSNLHLDQLSSRKTFIEPYSEKEAEDSLMKLLIFFSRADFSDRNKLVISLYFICGFNYSEIANALYLNIETVKKVISRSKETIKTFSTAYEDFPVKTIEQPDHLLRIIYLLFNEGYKSSQKTGMINQDLCFEAFRLAKLLQQYDSGNAKTNSLLATMYFHSSRFAARTMNNAWVSMEDQDRSLWDKNLISTGFFHLKKAKEKQLLLDKYYLEALISSVHCTSESYEQTDWKIIAYLYAQLEEIEPDSISVKLNRLIAESNFRELNTLLSEMHLLEKLVTNETAFFYYSTRAHLYTRLKNRDQAVTNYELALTYTKNKTDINFINGKMEIIRT